MNKLQHRLKFHLKEFSWWGPRKPVFPLSDHVVDDRDSCVGIISQADVSWTGESREVGKLVREVCAPLGGSAGGHGAMAGARVPLRGRSPELLAADIFTAFLKALHVRQGPGTPLVPMEP